ncbi:hypothetical protein QBC44DRAFT_362935 [Cladorrhinum sp. PSN332]|nr:hypothetical protein QBC44DRAFT_362935 [Cladorrhinum sp. PSN332]
MTRNFLTAKLPLELVDLIVGKLCPFCDQDIQDTWYHLEVRTQPPSYSQDLQSKKRALYSLCLTSSVLNHFATPHLYHHVSPHYLSNWFLLARTLIRRPDLAAHVKRIVGDSSAVYGRTILSLRGYYFYHRPVEQTSDPVWSHWADQTIFEDGGRPGGGNAHHLRAIYMIYPREVISYAHSAMRRALRESQPRIRWQRALHDLVYLYSRSLFDILQYMPFTGFSILISLCPNLEQLSAPRHQMCSFQYLTHRELFEGKSLQSLKIFVIQGQNRQKQSGPDDTLLRAMTIFPLFKAAPNLEVVACPNLILQSNFSNGDGRSMDIPIMKRLKALYLTQFYHVHIQDSYMEKLLDAWPNMKAFLFAQWNREQLPWSLVVDSTKMTEMIKSESQLMSLFVKDLMTSLNVRNWSQVYETDVSLDDFKTVIEERWNGFCTGPRFTKQPDSFEREALEFGRFVHSEGDK